MRAPVASRCCRLRRSTQLLVALLASAALTIGALAPRVLAQASTSTTWAVRVGEGSRCVADGSLLATLNAQIPTSQRADEEHAELVAEVTVVEQSARIVVFDRVLQSEAGARDLPLESRLCSDAIAAVSLVFGVLVEAGRGALQVTPPRVAPPPPPPPEQPKKQPAKAPPRPARPRPVWRGPPAGHDVTAAVGVNFGWVAKPTLGFTVGWGIRPASVWPIWLQASGFTGAESRDGHGEFHAAYGGLATCPLTGTAASIRLRACLGFGVGAVWAASTGLVENSSARRPLALAGLELGASAPLAGPLEFTLLARGDALLMRSRFYYTTESGDAATLFDPSILIGSVLAGLSLRFR